MKQFKAYLGRQSGKVTCINDAFGRSVAVFHNFYRPGDIAGRNVEHTKGNTEQTESHFRIIREVTDAEVQKLLILAECPKPASDGWWYEVIGD